MTYPNFRRSFNGPLDASLEKYLAAVERVAESERHANREIQDRVLEGAMQTAAMMATLKSAEDVQLNALLEAVLANPTSQNPTKENN